MDSGGNGQYIVSALKPAVSVPNPEVENVFHQSTAERIALAKIKKQPVAKSKNVQVGFHKVMISALHYSKKISHHGIWKKIICSSF